jgi:hypothetical protein
MAKGQPYIRGKIETCACSGTKADCLPRKHFVSCHIDPLDCGRSRKKAEVCICGLDNQGMFRSQLIA